MNRLYQPQTHRTDIRGLIRYHLVSCPLCEQECLYFLNVSFDDDFSCVYAGNDRERALRIYHLAVDGNVTPCTLEDIVEDAGIFSKTDLVICDKKILDCAE